MTNSEAITSTTNKASGTNTASATNPSTSQGGRAPSSASGASGAPIPNLNLPTGKAKWAMIILLFAINVNVSFMQSSMNVALDKVSTDFSISLSQANWVVLGYAIIVATVITTAASLLKRYGIRKVMLTSIVLALIGSIIGFVADDFALLMVSRVFQATATGLTFPVVSDALLTLAPDGKAGLLLSLNSGVIGLGLAVAPSLSGLLITYFNLKAIFLLPMVVSAILLVIAFFVLHNLYDRQDKKIDALSVVLSLLTLAPFMYGLNEISHQLVLSLILMGVAIIFGIAFVIRQKRLADPLLNLSPLKDKTFSLGETVMGIGYMGSLYLSLLTPLYLEDALGFTPFIAGCLLIAPIACYAIFCFIGGIVGRKHGVWPLVPLGFVITFVGYFALYFAASHEILILFLVCAGVAYAGIGLLFPLIKSADLEVLPKELASNGSSIHSTLVQIFGSISSALFVGLMSSQTATLMAQGMDKSAAYSTGFSFTLLIGMGLFAVALVGSIFYARRVVKIKGSSI